MIVMAKKPYAKESSDSNRENHNSLKGNYQLLCSAKALLLISRKASLPQKSHTITSSICSVLISAALKSNNSFNTS